MGALTTPGLSVGAQGTWSDRVIWALAALILASAAASAYRPRAAGRTRPVAGLALGAVAAFLLLQRDDGGVVVALALVWGMAAGLAGADLRAARRGPSARLAGVGVLVLLVVRVVAGRDVVVLAGLGALALTAMGAQAERGRGRAPRAGRRLTPIVVGAVVTALVAGYIGTNSPDAGWFGSVVTHGPRSQPAVAITFDDGPDDPYTLEIAKILDSRGAKGTFFTVGKALDARPDISRALMADGHLLGDHSYHHDGWRWLDPRYPELGRTQSAFRRQLGVCPTFYRPPHGQHTPFIAWAVDRKDMTMVTWDVAAGDWKSHDGAAVARDVLTHVKPGSIIVLHDGLDGTVRADRSVLLQALPAILDGLQAKGLRAVTLAELLQRPGYGDHC